MTSEITVPVYYVKNLLSSLEHQGCDVPELLSQLEIDADSIQQKTTFSAFQFGQLYQRAMLLMRDESVAMISASHVPIGSFRLMSMLSVHADTLGEAINRCSDFYEVLRGSVIKPVVTMEAGRAVFHFKVLDALPEGNIATLLDSESSLRVRAWCTMWLHYFSWLIGRRWILERVQFTAAKPDDIEYCEKLYQSRVDFNQPRNAFVFEEEVLDLPVVQNEQTLHSYLKSLPYQLIVMAGDDGSFSSRVSSQLGQDFSMELPNAEEMAHHFGISVSTLRRRLMEENSSYQKIKDDNRCAAAIRFLASPALTVAEVAALTGFDEPSTFFRAFKKWTGKTPGEYRRQIQLSFIVNR